MVSDIFIWDFIKEPTRALSEAVDNQSTTVINFFAPEEYEVTQDWNKHEVFSKLGAFAKHNELNMIYGCFDTATRRSRHTDPDNANIYFWGTFWATNTLTGLGNKITKQQNPAFKKLFTSFNNRPHRHRCRIIDILAKHDLLNNNDISWMSSDVEYDWKFWKPEVLTVDMPAGPSDRVFPLDSDSYNRTFMSVVSESTADLHFFTEKTWPHLFLKRPFLIAGAQGMHKKLESLGFELYDEVFDYSFDNEANEGKRYNLIAKNLKRLEGENWKKLYKQLHPKLEHNLELALYLATDDSLVPEPVHVLIQRDPECCYANMLRDSKKAKDQYLNSK